MNLTYRKAKNEDLWGIVSLLRQDSLGKIRESLSEILDERYIKAFHEINQDSNQYLMVAELNDDWTLLTQCPNCRGLANLLSRKK